jgi:hypothetical protein
MWQGRPPLQQIRLSEEIKALGVKGDMQGLLDVVRRQKKAEMQGGLGPLGWNAVVCSNWLNK